MCNTWRKSRAPKTSRDQRCLAIYTWTFDSEKARCFITTYLPASYCTSLFHRLLNECKKSQNEARKKSSCSLKRRLISKFEINSNEQAFSPTFLEARWKIKRRMKRDEKKLSLIRKLAQKSPSSVILWCLICYSGEKTNIQWLRQARASEEWRTGWWLDVILIPFSGITAMFFALSHGGQNKQTDRAN